MNPSIDLSEDTSVINDMAIEIGRLGGTRGGGPHKYYTVSELKVIMASMDISFPNLKRNEMISFIIVHIYGNCLINLIEPPS